MNEPTKDDEREDTPTEIAVTQRMELLDLVVEDLTIAFEMDLSGDAAPTEERETEATFMTVSHLVNTAVHLAAHGLAFDDAATFEEMMRTVMDAAIKEHRECITVLEAAKQPKDLS